MGRQREGSRLEGRVGSLVFYQWRGGFYVRSASTLTGKRFRRDKAFEGSRRCASLFAKASRLAGEVARKSNTMTYRQLQTLALKAFYSGASEEVVREHLLIEAGLKEKPISRSTFSARPITLARPETIPTNTLLLPAPRQPGRACNEPIDNSTLFLFSLFTS
jgi:hypothetical protein